MRVRRGSSGALRLALAAASTLAAQPLGAAVCNVPSAYPTIAAALADPGCNPIQVAAGSFPESPAVVRAVTIAGAGSASTTIAGWVSVRGAATVLVLDALRIEAAGASAALCSANGLDVRGGAKASGSDLVVAGAPAPIAACRLFADGFETGDTTVWSAHSP
jgi:hypothetical protein